MEEHDSPCSVTFLEEGNYSTRNALNADKRNSKEYFDQISRAGIEL